MRRQRRPRAMDGATAQTICLAIHGSAWLARPAGPPPRLEESCPASFGYVGSVTFVLHRSRGRGAVEAAGCAGWLEGLRERGIDRLWLDLPGALRTSHEGRGAALIATEQGRPAQTWRARWSLGNRDAPDRRIWSVRYEGVKAPGKTRIRTPPVAAAMADLEKALGEVIAFCESRSLPEWKGAFEQALARGAAEDPEPPYYPDMVRRDVMDLASRRVVCMAAQANVFGGMGSWTDMGFQDEAQEAYAAVSERLRRAVLTGLLAGVNAEPRRG